MSDLISLPKPSLATRDSVTRCYWPGIDELYCDYHDNEWGLPVDDDGRLFEKICLEGFQAGLSWITILRKRESFREAFADFDFQAVAKFNGRDVNRLLKNAGIIRHRGKIEATINNAKRAIEMVDEFGSLAAWFWQFESKSGVTKTTMAGLTKTSTDLSKQLKKRGWKFVGPTTAYAFMQAMGLVNDHVPGCDARKVVAQARKDFIKPAIREL